MKYVTIQLGPDYQLVFSEVVYWNFSLLNTIGDFPPAYEVSIYPGPQTTASGQLEIIFYFIFLNNHQSGTKSN